MEDWRWLTVFRWRDERRAYLMIALHCTNGWNLALFDFNNDMGGLEKEGNGDTRMHHDCRILLYLLDFSPIFFSSSDGGDFQTSAYVKYMDMDFFP
jgi:hypothetical protein